MLKELKTERDKTKKLLAKIEAEIELEEQKSEKEERIKEINEK